MSNLLSLYDNKFGWDIAQNELIEVANEALDKIRKCQEKHEGVGANDTASREAMAQYLSDNL